MALVGTVSGTTVFGDKKVAWGTLAWDSSYPTGGEAYTAATFGLKTLDHAIFEESKGYSFEIDAANSKIEAWIGASGARVEVTNTTDISAITAAPWVAFGS